MTDPNLQRAISGQLDDARSVIAEQVGEAVVINVGAAVVFEVGVPPPTPFGAVVVVVNPSGVPPVDAAENYGSLNALSISPRNSKTKRR